MLPDARYALVQTLSAALFAFGAMVGAPVAAQGQLNVICPVQAEWCKLVAIAFEKETGIKVAMSHIKGARNLDNAKKFVDWALAPKAQALGTQARQYQLPSNAATPISPLSPKMADIKLINYDFAKYGTSAERKRLLERRDKKVGSFAK